MTTTSAQHQLRVLIAGTGVAALETLLALRDLVGEHVAVTMVAPEDHFAYRPLATAKPFGLGPQVQLEVSDLAQDLGAHLARGRVSRVDTDHHVAFLEGGRELRYDVLVLATGARAQAVEHAVTFGLDPAELALHDVIAELETGYVDHRVAFVATSARGWLLPLYELALQMADGAWAAEMTRGRFYLVSPEPRPLALFGSRASHEVELLLAQRGIQFFGGTDAALEPGKVTLSEATPGTRGRVLEVSATFALPALAGPALDGVPADEAGFVPVDEYGRVPHIPDVFAAGDCTVHPVKQGGLATQQADAVATAIAARVDPTVKPEPYAPVLRGLLLAGGERRFLRREPSAKEGDLASLPLWWPPSKVAGRYLAPYLHDREEKELIRRRGSFGLSIDAALDPAAASRSPERGLDRLMEH